MIIFKCRSVRLITAVLSGLEPFFLHCLVLARYYLLSFDIRKADNVLKQVSLLSSFLY